MGNPGYGPLCGELEKAYQLMAELVRDVASMADDSRRADAVRRLEIVRDRVKRCESRLLVVSYGKEAPCDLKGNCQADSPQA